MTRPTWTQYFLNLAAVVATRATCDRAHVGCVLVRDRRVLATGYNGSVSGAEHCDDVGHYMVDGHCVRTVHDAANALAQAARHGVSTEGATAYVTHCPCLNCAKQLASSGVREVYASQSYRPEATLKALCDGVLGPFSLTLMDRQRTYEYGTK